MMEKGFVALPTKVNKHVEPFVDMGNLLIVDNDPMLIADDLRLTEEELLIRVRDNTQFLFNKIWELERMRVDEAICAKLPAPSMRLPREKPVPDKRQPTKWEQYSQQKGIRKKKRDRKVFDEKTQEWKARYGYRRAENETKDWLIEIPDNKDPMVDYFEERIKAKKERVSKNEMQRLRNIAHSHSNISSANATPLGVSTDLNNRTRRELANQINRTRFATASHGAYQPGIKNEKKLLKTGKRNKYESNEAAVSDERKKQLGILDRLSFKKPDLDETRLVASQQNNLQQENVDKKQRKGLKRSKSTVHRQQHFQNKVKKMKKTRGNSVKAGKQKKDRSKIFRSN